jgi:mono/diheme cytochrome c family protein
MPSADDQREVVTVRPRALRLGGAATAVLFAALVGVPRLSLAAPAAGKQDFMKNCAPCHGTDGKGHGEDLYVIPEVKPPDLTVLSRNNGGTFPTRRVYDSIDGRNGIPSHERFDMPFWGTTFQWEGEEFTPASNAAVKARIMKIVEYVKSIQQR